MDIKAIMVLAVGGLILSSGVIGWAGECCSSKPKMPDPARWEKAVKVFEDLDKRNYVPEDGIVFAGSSSIYCWETRRFFPDLPVINRGISASLIHDLSYYVDRLILPYKPKVVVVYAGDNDFMEKRTPEQICGDFKEIVAKVHKELPKTQIVYLAIKPCPRRFDMWEGMKKANGLISKFAGSKEGVCFVDVATPMLGKDGKPVPELYRDGLHFSEKGYQIWHDVAGPVIREKFAD